MGAHVNPDNHVLLADMRQEIYVGKSVIMTGLNKVFGTSTLSRVCHSGHDGGQSRGDAAGVP